MPGDLRGLNTEGSVKLLQTYGMAAVELTGSSGELLQIVNGQKATLTFPIPSSLAASAPASIPLWYFDEAIGLWKQDGSATKTGNTYVGDVSHFSFWNCDVPRNYVQFNCTLKNSSGNPLPYTLVKITVVGSNHSGFGYTDSSGYVGGAVPNNANLVLEVFPNSGCLTPLYSQNFATTNVNASLGIITIPTANNLATINGAVTNCASTPVTNGYILVQEGNVFTRYTLSNTGAYSFSKVFCSFPQTITLIGEDVANAQQGPGLTYLINTGTNTIGNIQACGTTTQQFINYTINSINYTFTAPADTFYYGHSPTAIDFTGHKIPSNTAITIMMSNAGITMGSTQNLLAFVPGHIPDTFRILAPIQVNITEYGAVGQFVAGNFAGTCTGVAPANTPYNITCNFRVRITN